MPALSGVAAAHFPLELDVDVQPQNEDNVVDVERHDSVAVAVRPTTFLDGDGERPTFDPTAEPVRYRFGSRAALQDGEGARSLDDGTVTEVDGGHGDSQGPLVLEFPRRRRGIRRRGGDGVALLRARRRRGHGDAGVDSLTLYGAGTSDRGFFDLLRQLFRRRGGPRGNRARL